MSLDEACSSVGRQIGSPDRPASAEEMSATPKVFTFPPKFMTRVNENVIKIAYIFIILAAAINFSPLLC